MWPIPEVLDVSVGITHDGEDNPVSGVITGLVAGNVTRLLVTFESGDTIEITPDETTQLGLKGFGLASFNAAQLGEPTTIEVFAGDESLGMYSHAPGASP
jgi:hypothetical protein